MKYIKEILEEVPGNIDIQSGRDRWDQLLKEIMEDKNRIYEIDWRLMGYNYPINCRRMGLMRIEKHNYPLRMVIRHKKLYVIKVEKET